MAHCATFGKSKISNIFLSKNLGSVHYPKELKNSFGRSLVTLDFAQNQKKLKSLEDFMANKPIKPADNQANMQNKIKGIVENR